MSIPKDLKLSKIHIVFRTYDTKGQIVKEETRTYNPKGESESISAIGFSVETRRRRWKPRDRSLKPMHGKKL